MVYYINMKVINRCNQLIIFVINEIFCNIESLYVYICRIYGLKLIIIYVFEFKDIYIINYIFDVFI